MAFLLLLAGAFVEDFDAVVAALDLDALSTAFFLVAALEVLDFLELAFEEAFLAIGFTFNSG
jgi:hypothetical protein